MSKSRQKTPAIDLNPEFKQALVLMEDSGKSVFITGRAGTGKSTLLTYFCQTTRKKVVILAPTGVAALNVKGQTIHSFFKFRPNITQERVRKLRSSDEGKNIYQKLDAIVIDEISMVRADLLDCVDKFLRLNGPSEKKPFGGIQMIFIGDLYQLSPVVTGSDREIFRTIYKSPYFYSAHVFDTFEMEFIELQKVYRQHDEKFIDLLNSVRNNTITEKGLALLKQRYIPDFEPTPGDFCIYLTTTNAMAETINTAQLAKLDSPPLTFQGEIEGEFGKENLPTAIDLNIKPGAQIMMLNNDTEGRWVNGSVGEIRGLKHNNKGEDVIIADLNDGSNVEIEPFTWEIYRSYVDGEQLASEVIGTFTQYPLMLAWAVTIHKSQGKTFNNVVIDIGRGAFAHGQTYVALSRCTSLEGIVLVKPLQKKDIWTDFKVVDFLTKYQYKKAEHSNPVSDKIALLEKAIRSKTTLKITYLKPNDEKSVRTIRPEAVGEMGFAGKTYLGVIAFCLMRNQLRTFRVDRILEMEEVQESRSNPI
jgi:ATP-dependent exoDNAse (exonuclease V) alpha subunit